MARSASLTCPLRMEIKQNPVYYDLAHQPMSDPDVTLPLLQNESADQSARFAPLRRSTCIRQRALVDNMLYISSQKSF